MEALQGELGLVDVEDGTVDVVEDDDAVVRVVCASAWPETTSSTDAAAAETRNPAVCERGPIADPSKRIAKAEPAILPTRTSTVICSLPTMLAHDRKAGLCAYGGDLIRDSVSKGRFYAEK